MSTPSPGDPSDSDSPDWGWRFFSPAFGNDDDGEQHEEPADVRPSGWDNWPETSDPRDCPIDPFLPHLSLRSQRILRQLGVQTVADVLQLSREQVFACERGNDTVLVEWQMCFLEPRQLSANWLPESPG